MRIRGWAVLLAALLLAAPALHAQQQERPAEPPLPERVIKGIGDAIRGIFRAILGDQEGALPAPGESAPKGEAPQTPPPAEPAGPGAAKPAAPVQERAAAEPQPVKPTPSAQVAPQTLHAAIAQGEYAVALGMIEQGADIEAKDPGAGASPLHYAVMKGSMTLIGVLLAKGADVNSRTKSGTTPLHTAVLYARYEAAERLLTKGADVNARSASGTTPLALAEAARNSSLQRLLRERGGR